MSVLVLAGLCGGTGLSFAAADANGDFPLLTNRIQLAQLPKSVPHVQWAADLEGAVLIGGSELVVVSFDALGQTRIIDARSLRGSLKQAQRLPFGIKAGDDILGIHPKLDDLQRHQALHRLLLFREIDDTASALAELLEQLVAPHFLAGLLARGR